MNEGEASVQSSSCPFLLRRQRWRIVSSISFLCLKDETSAVCLDPNISPKPPNVAPKTIVNNNTNKNCKINKMVEKKN